MISESNKKPYLFSKNGGIGDAYIQLPMLRAFNHFFKGKLIVLTSEFNRSLYLGEKFHDIIVFPPEIPLQPTGYSALNYELDQLALILTHADYYVDSNVWFLKDKGYEDYIQTRPYPTLGFFNFFSNHTKPDFSINSFDSAFSLVKQVDESLKIENFAFPPLMTEEVSNFVDKVKSKFPEDIIVLGIQDETKQNKMWLAGNFEAVINKLLNKYSNIAVIIFGKNTKIDSGVIIEKERILHFEQSFDFPAMNGIMHLVDFFIGIDSVFLHLADLHAIPSIALFGPTSTKEWGLRFTEGIEVISPTGNMSDISIENVINAFETLIQKVAT